MIRSGERLQSAPVRSKALLLRALAIRLMNEMRYRETADTALYAIGLLTTARDTSNLLSAELLKIAGSATMRAGTTEPGLRLLDRCKVLADHLDERDLLRKAMAGRFPDLLLGDTVRARTELDRCLEDGRVHHDTLELCQCLNNYAAYLGTNTLFDRAYKCNSMVIDLCRVWSSPDPLETTRALGDASTYMGRVGKFQEAGQLLDEIPDLVDIKNAPPKPRVVYLLNKGRQWHLCNDFGRALPFSLEALAVCREARFDLEEPKIYLNCVGQSAGQLAQTGQEARAVQLLDSILAIARFNTPGNASVIGLLHNNLAAAHERLGNTAKVIEHCKAVKAGSAVGMALFTLHKAYRTSGNDQAADSCLLAYRNAFAERPSQNAFQAFSTSLLNDADFARLRGDWPTSLDRVDEALALFSGSPVGPTTVPDFQPGTLPRVNLLFLRAKTEAMFWTGRRTGDRDLLRASARLDSMLRPVYDTLMQVVSDPNERRDLFDFAAQTAARRIAHALGDDRTERDGPFWLSILNEMEYKRDRNLAALNSTSVTEAERGLPKNLVDKENELAGLLRRYMTNGAERQDSTITALIDTLETVRSKLRVLDPRYFSLRSRPEKVNHRALLSALPDERTAILDLHLSGEDSTLVAVVVRKSGITGYVINIPASDIDSLIADVRSAANSGLARERSRRFHGSIIAPLLDATATDRVIIIPDNALFGLPFEALITSGSDDPHPTYLADKLSIEYATSIRMFMLKDRAAKEDNALAYTGFAPAYKDLHPDGSTGGKRGSEDLLRSMGPLESNDEEVEAASDLFDGLAFIGTGAREREFHQIAPEAGLLHLAVHGVADQSDAMNSKLLFEGATSMDTSSASTDDDGFLHFRELYTMHLKADLAVLSACETGVGSYQQGEGVMSMARAFNYAGVPNVVSSLWKVDDRATKEIMVKFYEKLAEGMGKADALAEAKRWYRKENPNAPPSHWAAFILIGDNEPVHLKKRSPVRPWMWGGAVAVIVAAVAARRRRRMRQAA